MNQSFDAEVVEDDFLSDVFFLVSEDFLVDDESDDVLESELVELADESVDDVSLAEELDDEPDRLSFL